METNQRLDVAGNPALPPPTSPDGTQPLRAPSTPGFFDAAQGQQPLLAAAAHFADAREADFRDAATLDTLADKNSRLVERNSRQDVLWPVAALLLGAFCLASWAATGESRRSPVSPVPQSA